MTTRALVGLVDDLKLRPENGEVVAQRSSHYRARRRQLWQWARLVEVAVGEGGEGNTGTA